MASSVTVRAPSSTANLGPGFDVFGLALDAFFDEITITKKGKGIRIITLDSIPVVPKKNTAGVVVTELANKFKIKDGIEVKIKKGVPAGFGVGSSAASASAAVVAMNRLFKLNLDNNSLVKFAGAGEKASAGSIHYDNVAASVLGGFVIVRTDPLDVIRIEPPSDLVLCIAIPDLKVPAKKTEVSRSVVPKTIKLAEEMNKPIKGVIIRKPSKKIRQNNFKPYFSQPLLLEKKSQNRNGNPRVRRTGARTARQAAAFAGARRLLGLDSRVAYDPGPERGILADALAESLGRAGSQIDSERRELFARLRRPQQLA